MTELVYIKPLSSAKIVAAISIVLGFIAAIIIVFLGLFSVLASLVIPVSTVEAGADLLSGVLQVIVTTIALAILGFITGGIAAFIYNIAAGIFGGLDLGFVETHFFPAEDEPENENSIGYE
jgi:hypothetical protein